MKRLLLLLVLAFYCAGISAQETRGSQGSQVMEVNAYMAYLRASEVSARNLNSNSSRLENLLKEVQPAIYFRSGEIRTYGENPTALYTDVASLQSLSSRITGNESIEIITISMNQTSDLSSPIDLSAFSNFPNLKYIYIMSTIETSGNVISGLIRNNNARFGVFYKVDKGS
ncbi:MAG: hypothetical protein IPN80_12425 [Flavobacterium sp.]|nr:hypothetical protein [Flavobacterium sp.]